MNKKVLLTATVQSHIAQFHKPLAKMLHDNGYEVHVAAKNNLAEKNGLEIDFADKVFDVPFDRTKYIATSDMVTYLFTTLQIMFSYFQYTPPEARNTMDNKPSLYCQGQDGYLLMISMFSLHK